MFLFSDLCGGFIKIYNKIINMKIFLLIFYVTKLHP